MDDCIFCKIISGDIPSAKIFEDDEFIAFLDISPANKGHTLIVPKQHYDTYIEASEIIVCKMAKLAQKIAKAIVTSTNCTGYNIQINNNKDAGQEVPHLHMHIIPRFKVDDFKLAWTHKIYSDGEMNKFADEIKGNLE